MPVEDQGSQDAVSVVVYGCRELTTEKGAQLFASNVVAKEFTKGRGGRGTKRRQDTKFKLENGRRARNLANQWTALEMSAQTSISE